MGYEHWATYVKINIESHWVALLGMNNVSLPQFFSVIYGLMTQLRKDQANHERI